MSLCSYFFIYRLWGDLSLMPIPYVESSFAAAVFTFNYASKRIEKRDSFQGLRILSGATTYA